MSRTAGSLNKRTLKFQEIVDAVCKKVDLAEKFAEWLKHPDMEIQLKAAELLISYGFSRPKPEGLQAVGGYALFADTPAEGIEGSVN